MQDVEARYNYWSMMKSKEMEDEQHFQQWLEWNRMVDGSDIDPDVQVVHDTRDRELYDAYVFLFGRGAFADVQQGFGLQENVWNTRHLIHHGRVIDLI